MWGTTRVPDASKKSGFKLTGDVKFDEVAPKCSYITPVPGGGRADDHRFVNEKHIVSR